jgi:hypothetical protein
MIEIIVMSDIFNWLFKKLDPTMEQILGHIPGTVFSKHFASLFAESNQNLSLAVFDLIFAFGSGVMRGTCAEMPMEPVNDEDPLCRTQQLLLCVALVMTRQVLYSFRVRKEVPQKMSMNQFET